MFPRAGNTLERRSVLWLMQNLPREAASTEDHRGRISDPCQKHSFKNPHAEDIISSPSETRWGDAFQQIFT